MGTPIHAADHISNIIQPLRREITDSQRSSIKQQRAQMAQAKPNRRDVYRVHAATRSSGSRKTCICCKPMSPPDRTGTVKIRGGSSCRDGRKMPRTAGSAQHRGADAGNRQGYLGTEQPRKRPLNRRAVPARAGLEITPGRKLAQDDAVRRRAAGKGDPPTSP